MKFSREILKFYLDINVWCNPHLQITNIISGCYESVIEITFSFHMDNLNLYNYLSDYVVTYQSENVEENVSLLDIKFRLTEWSIYVTEIVFNLFLHSDLRTNYQRDVLRS